MSFRTVGLQTPITALTVSTKNLKAALDESHVIKQIFFDAKRDHGPIENALLVVIAAGKLEGLELMAGSKEKAEALESEWLAFRATWRNFLNLRGL